MTARQVLVVDVADIQALRLECLKCGAAVSFKPTAPSYPADYSASSVSPSTQCQNCAQGWPPGHSLDDSRKLVQRLVAALRDLQESAPGHKPGFRVHFEIERSWD